jgi:3',5'-cyclic-nucleotide phosphodiesterase
MYRPLFSRLARLAVSGLLALAVGSCKKAGPPPEPGRFTAIVLGAGGGLYEGDLSAFLLAPAGSTDFISLDAGTILSGLRRAHERGSLRGLEDPKNPAGVEGEVFRRHIQAYLLSHPHLDHLGGLVIGSPDDEKKVILGLDPTLDALRDHLLNGVIWAPMGNEGKGALGKYAFTRLQPGVAVEIPRTTMRVEAMPLSHAGGVSTAFLIGAKGDFVLYFGDTGADRIEGGHAMQAVWERVAPLIRQRALAGVFLECSYLDGRPDKLLFGHLTPTLVREELGNLARLVDPARPAEALRGLRVFITHIKPSLDGVDIRGKMAVELESHNDLGLRWHLVEQGERVNFLAGARWVEAWSSRGLVGGAGGVVWSPGGAWRPCWPGRPGRRPPARWEHRGLRSTPRPTPSISSRVRC